MNGLATVWSRPNDGLLINPVAGLTVPLSRKLSVDGVLYHSDISPTFKVQSSFRILREGQRFAVACIVGNVAVRIAGERVAVDGERITIDGRNALVHTKAVVLVFRAPESGWCRRPARR